MNRALGGLDCVRVLARDRVDEEFHQLLRNDAVMAMHGYRLTVKEAEIIEKYSLMRADDKRKPKAD